MKPKYYKKRCKCGARFIQTEPTERIMEDRTLTKYKCTKCAGWMEECLIDKAAKPTKT